MEIDKAIFNYYKSEVDKVITPTPAMPGKIRKISTDRVYNLVFAAAILLACIPLLSNINMPSALSIRAAQFSEYHKLDSVIPAGLLKINRLVSESLISGGNK